MTENRKLPTPYEGEPPPTNPTVRRLLVETSRTMLAVARRKPRASGTWKPIHPDNQRLFTEIDASINAAEVRFWEARIRRYES